MATDYDEVYGELRNRDVELKLGLERAMANMTGVACDESLMDAFLDGPDGKAPLPAHPDVFTAYERFRRAAKERYGIDLPPFDANGGRS